MYEGSHLYTATVTIAIAAFVGAAVLLLAVLFLGKGRPESADPAGRGTDPVHAGGPAAVKPGTCPLCSTPLGPGERVKSDIFPGKGDRLMRIFGCPRCLATEGGPPRFCPVCGTELAPGSWALARYFERPGRRHVHVLGCESCRPSSVGRGR